MFINLNTLYDIVPSSHKAKVTKIKKSAESKGISLTETPIFMVHTCVSSGDFSWVVNNTNEVTSSNYKILEEAIRKVLSKKDADIFLKNPNFEKVKDLSTVDSQKVIDHYSRLLVADKNTTVINNESKEEPKEEPKIVAPTESNNTDEVEFALVVSLENLTDTIVKYTGRSKEEVLEFLKPATKSEPA